MQEQSIEKWRPVVGYEGIYEVSNLGSVRRIVASRGRAKAGLILKPHVGHDGYRYVGLYRLSRPKRASVPALVAEAFIGPRPPTYEVNHQDGKKTNDVVDNLEWVTKSGNSRHAFLLGLNVARKGEASGRAKLTEVDVLEIRRLRGIFTQDSLAIRFGVSKQQIWMIQRHHSWRHL